MHFCYPVAQTVDDETANHGMVTVDGVSTARKILVVLLVLVFQNIIDGIVKTAEIQGESMLVSFCGVVEYNVQNNFDSRLVEFLYHFFKFPYYTAGTSICCVGGFGGKEGDGAVAPVVFQSASSAGIGVGVFVFVKLLNGEQFHAGNSQFLQVGNLFCHTTIGSGELHLGGGTGGKALQVGFVDDGILHAVIQGAVSFPVEFTVVNYHALWKASSRTKLF